MGRIKTTLVKRSAEEFLSRYPDAFKNKFDENKTKLNELGQIESKKLRNKIAGYLTRLNRKKK
ncbi:TPA: 30S ribosomal protein S17e [Candidatus Woesearchaeota archaeon]|nr:30S ribosomal protein S17e [Candidatus Woesearchaeota archaeon]|tara:strand:+ start:297 stop:485 length:189 start_codon:yes stop_codon:yes gene_type:complete